MSMSVTISQVISDNNGKQMFQFPKNTLLDNILIDLWNNIMRYYTTPFAVGLRNKTYPGYRLVTEDDVNNNFIEMFRKYKTKDNRLYLLDHLDYRATLRIGEYFVEINEDRVSLTIGNNTCYTNFWLEGDDEEIDKCYTNFWLEGDDEEIDKCDIKDFEVSEYKGYNINNSYVLFVPDTLYFNI